MINCIRFNKSGHIKIIKGDSAKILNEIVPELTGPAIFWLDGHYSGGITARGDKDCPIYEEIDAILKNRKFNHIILIDDARCFTGEGDYPTVNQLTEYIKYREPKYEVLVESDIIRYVIVQ